MICGSLGRAQERLMWAQEAIFLIRSYVYYVCSVNTDILLLLFVLLPVSLSHQYWHSLHLPCPFTSSSFALFLLFPFLVGFNYFLLLSIPFLSTRIVPLRFQAGGRRKRLNLGLVGLFILCYLYSLVKMDFGVLLYLV